MEFRVPVPVEVVAAGRPLALGAPKQRALLALLLRVNQVVSRDRLIEDTWGEQAPQTRPPRCTAISPNYASYSPQAPARGRRGW